MSSSGTSAWDLNPPFRPWQALPLLPPNTEGEAGALLLSGWPMEAKETRKETAQICAPTKDTNEVAR